LARKPTINKMMPRMITRVPFADASTLDRSRQKEELPNK